MLREDPLGGQIGDFVFRGLTYEYHVEGSGNPVLITHRLSGTADSYVWRYIFDCLAGTFLAYALDITGPSDRLEYGRAHYASLVEAFVRAIVREKTSIIASPDEASYVLLAAYQAPRLVDRVILACADGTVMLRARGSIARETVERRLGIPRIEEVVGGKAWRPAGCAASLRRFATGRITGIGGRNALFRRAGARAGGIDPLRFCEDAIRFLG